MTDTCRSCRADVVFVKSAATGKPMILDAKPDKGIVIFDGFNGEIATLHHVLGERGQEYREQCTALLADVWTDHHVTCPDAASWKGRHR